MLATVQSAFKLSQTQQEVQQLQSRQKALTDHMASGSRRHSWFF